MKYLAIQRKINEYYHVIFKGEKLPMKINKSAFMAFLTGTPIGTLGGLIGLGGAEFRLPFLVGLFNYSARQAVVINLAISFITLLSSLIFRLPDANLYEIKSLLFIIGAFIIGGMTGAYTGANYLKNISEVLLEKIIFILLLFIGLLLIGEAVYPVVPHLASMATPILILVALLFGIGIGIVSSLLGVAGGELIIPTLILIFGVDVKTAGIASLMISLPTVSIGLLKHGINGSFPKGKDVTSLIIPMGIGSIIGAFIGGLLIHYFQPGLLKIILGIILIISAVKMFIKTLKNS